MPAPYAQHLSVPAPTPQAQPIPGREAQMAANSAGGFGFPKSDWHRADEFMILGAEGGSYYAFEQALTVENAAAVLRCLAADGTRLVARAVQISQEGRAAKQDPVLFVLALAAAFGVGEIGKEADSATALNVRRAALGALPVVARTGTALFTFVSYMRPFRSWGRAVRRAIGHGWYVLPPAEKVAFQMAKYRSRAGWTHADLLRLTHPLIPIDDPARRAAVLWSTHPERVRDDGTIDISDRTPVVEKDEAGRSRRTHVGADAVLAPLPSAMAAHSLLHRLVTQCEGAVTDEVVQAAAATIRTTRLPRECVPTELLARRPVWEALFHDMPITALIRSLGKLTSVGVLEYGSPLIGEAILRLTSAEAIRAARVHPIQVLLAARTYAQGHGEKGKLAWTPVPRILDALDAAWDLAFQTVRPTGKTLLVGVDDSGSMHNTRCVGADSLTAAEAAAAVALTFLRTEPNTRVVSFTTDVREPTVSARQRIDDFLRTMPSRMQSTDCAAPIAWATAKQVPVDAFVLITDGETWAGNQHVTEAMRRYRQTVVPRAKLAVLSTSANAVSIVDPSDRFAFGCAGFDAAVPRLVHDFIAGGAEP